jgi:hypothetical protein
MFNFRKLYPKEDEMKKLLVLVLVLSMATMANAALTLSVSSTDLLAGGAATISISGDGTTPPGEFFLGINLGGPGALNITNAGLDYVGSAKSLAMDGTYAGDLGMIDPYVDIQLTDLPTPPNPVAQLNGLLVHGIGLTAGNIAGVVTLVLYNTNGEVQATQDVTISTVPEPITVGLLGLGAMFLRRRK